MNAKKARSSCVIMPCHYWKLLHQIFGTLILLGPINHCIVWMMLRVIMLGKNIWHETMFQHTNICTKKNNEYIMKWLLHNLYPSLKLIYTLIYDQYFPFVLKSDPNMFKVLHTYAWISITRSEICFPITLQWLNTILGMWNL